MSLLTKDEWTAKVYRGYLRCTGIELPYGEDKFWWHRIGNNSSMRLSEKGFERFREAKISFYEFSIPLGITWTAALLIGLTRMPSPHYFYGKSTDSILYIADEQIALLFKFQDDIENFARGYV